MVISFSQLGELHLVTVILNKLHVYVRELLGEVAAWLDDLVLNAVGAFIFAIDYVTTRSTALVSQGDLIMDLC